MIKEYLTYLRHKRTIKKLDNLMWKMSTPDTYGEYVKLSEVLR